MTAEDEECFEETRVEVRTPGRTRSVLEMDNLDWLVPPIRVTAPRSIPFVRWVLPLAWHGIDSRMIRRFRTAYDQSDRIVPLVVQVGGRVAEWTTSTLLAWDDAALSIERAWTGEWMDVPKARRPPLLLCRPDGGVAIGVNVEAALLPAVTALSAARVISVHHVKAAFDVCGKAAPSPPVVSRALKALQQQGLLYRLGQQPLACSTGQTWPRRPWHYASLLARILDERQHSTGGNFQVGTNAPEDRIRECLMLAARLRRVGLRDLP